MTQFDLFSTHAQDNNPESTETLSINRRSFEGQNKRLLELLMSGQVLSFSDAYINHGISDIRRRIKDLRDIGGFAITDRFIDGTRNKEWFCSEAQRKDNKKLLTTVK